MTAQAQAPPTPTSPPVRYVGLDIHKHYLVATAVDAHQQTVYGPRRVAYPALDRWLARALQPTDAVVLEMTTNTWEMVDRLTPMCSRSPSCTRPKSKPLSRRG